MATATALADPATNIGAQPVAGPTTTLDDPTSIMGLGVGGPLDAPGLTDAQVYNSVGDTGSPLSLDTSSAIPAINDSSATSDDSGGLSSILSGLGTAVSDVGGVLNSPLGTLGLLGGEYALISGQASATQNQNNQLAGQISAIGQPDVTAGQNLLSSYTAGQLTAPYQAQLTAAQQANQNTATSQSQQVAQLLANSGGGQNVQSAQVSESGQIAAAQNLANTQAMSQAFLQELTDSLSLTQTGGAYVQAGIMQEIQSNTQLQQQLSALMGQLANAYAKSVAGSGSGTGTGAAGTGTGSGLGSIFNQAGKLLSGSSAGPDVSSLVSGANAGATAAGAGGAAALGTDVTGVDAQLAAGANAPLTLGTTDPFSVTAGPLIQDPALGLGTDAVDTAGSVASDTAGAVSDFSAGSAAAGAASSGLTAADLSVAAPDLAGIATPSAASLLGGEGAAAGAESAGAAAGTAGASSSAVASLAAVAAPVAAALGIGYLAYEGLATSTPDTIKTVGPGQSLTTLQSGDTALQQGAFAIGTGSNRGAGAGQQFIIPQTTVTIGGKTAQAGVPFALPDNIVTGAGVLGSIPTKNGQPDFSSITYDPNATTIPNAQAAQPDPTGFGYGVGTDPAAQAAADAKYNSQALSASYNITGGQAAWGVPFQTWVQQTYDVHNNISGEVWA